MQFLRLTIPIQRFLLIIVGAYSEILMINSIVFVVKKMKNVIIVSK